MFRSGRKREKLMGGHDGFSVANQTLGVPADFLRKWTLKVNKLQLYNFSEMF